MKMVLYTRGWRQERNASHVLEWPGGRLTSNTTGGLLGM